MLEDKHPCFSAKVF